MEGIKLRSAGGVGACGVPGEDFPRGAQNTLNVGAVMFGVGCSWFFALMQLLSV